MKKSVLAVMISAVIFTSTLLSACEAQNSANSNTDNGGDQNMVIENITNKSDGLYTTHQGNPYLPLWEYIPDGEPHIFEDPDNPGKYRLYIYGSHDILKTQFCGKDLVVWSAPVENLQEWRYDGVIFESPTFGGEDYDILYAPDIVCREEDGKAVYYLYPNNQTQNRNTMIARGYRPDGPFEVFNWADDSENATFGILGFDPAVYIDDDGKVYGYWGFGGYDCSYWGVLDGDNMADLAEGESAHKNIPSYDNCHSDNYNPEDYNIVIDEHVKDWGFFEASSIRKVGNKYVFIYSRNGNYGEPEGKHYSQLAYGYSDSPAGPWTYGGIIIDALGEVIPNGDGSYSRTTTSWANTHGSICEVEGQWYIFYHRCLNSYARQSMVEPITVEWDEKSVEKGGKVRISRAEVTSNGFFLDGLDPYRKHSAGIASYITGGAGVKPVYDKDSTTSPIVGIKDGAVIGIKYFNLDVEAEKGKNTNLELEIKPLGVTATVDVYLRPMKAVNTPVERDKDGNITSVGEGSELIGSFKLTKDMPAQITTFKIPVSEVDKKDGQWGLFLVFNSNSGNDICEWYNLEFTQTKAYLSDSFESRLSSWKTEGDVSVKDGVMVLSEGSAATAKKSDGWSNCSISANIDTMKSGKLAIRFLETDENNYYKLSVTNEGMALSSVMFGEETLLDEATYEKLAKAFNITVDANGEAVAVKLNGIAVIEAKDFSHNMGKVTFASEEGEISIADVNIDESKYVYSDSISMSDLTYEILIDGEPLESFNIDVTDYTVAIDDSTAIPTVGASCSSDAVAVSISQADEASAAIVRFVAKSGIVKQYVIRFREAMQSTDFDGLTSLPEGWEYVNNMGLSFDSEGVVFDTEGTDRKDYPGEGYPAIGASQRLEGNWQVDAAFKASEPLNFSGWGAYGLGLYTDSGKFVKFVVQGRYDWQNLQLAGTGFSEINVGANVSASEYALRLVKSGNKLVAYASDNSGISYKEIANAVLEDDFDSAQLQIFATKVEAPNSFTATLKAVSVTVPDSKSVNAEEQVTLEGMSKLLDGYIVIPESGDIQAEISKLLEGIDGEKSVTVDGNIATVTVTNGKSQVTVSGIEVIYGEYSYAGLRELVSKAEAIDTKGMSFAHMNKLESALALANRCDESSSVKDVAEIYKHLEFVLSKIA